MDPISNADRLVLLLRQKLLERFKAGAKDRTARNAKRSIDTTEQPSDLQALAAIDGVDERNLRRTVIQHLLADHLGPALTNDAQFQQIVSRVTDAIEEDPAMSQLLSRVVLDLRRP